jgi:hypothetical protein
VIEAYRAEFEALWRKSAKVRTEILLRTASCSGGVWGAPAPISIFRSQAERRSGKMQSQ